MVSKKIFLKKGKDRILKSDIGKIFLVYNGRKFIKIKVSSLMLGFCFGCFVLTRKAGLKHKNKDIAK